ncbi:MAG TPA: hypothetical protein PKE16_08020 [Hyphomicrobium sp.]|nr:hypothetical protein [Hyphomicrobium sp.]
MTYRYISWNGDEARLKNFTSAMKSGGASVVKIEITVRNPSDLGWLLRELGEIQQQQDAADKAAAAEAKRPKRRAIENKPPLLLTFRED